MLDNFIIGDTGAELNVSKVTIGKEGSAEPVADETAEKDVSQTCDAPGLVMSIALAGLGLSAAAFVSTRKTSKASR